MLILLLLSSTLPQTHTHAHNIHTHIYNTHAHTQALAHSVAGVTCPGCKMNIVEEVKDSKTETKVHGDKPPKKKQKSWKGKTWLELHMSIVYGRYMLLKLSVDNYSVCILHMSLRIVNGLFMNLIVNKIGKSSTPNVDQVADLVKIVTKDAGAYMKESKLKAKSKNIDGEWRKVAFAGADAGKINQVHENLLESVHPKADRDKNTATQGQWERSTTCWQQWLVVWDLLNADVRPEETIESR